MDFSNASSEAGNSPLRVPWGYVAALQSDPIEKKPFSHVLPGSDALTFGMLGCDFHCSYCQNWVTSQAMRAPDADVAVSSVRKIKPQSMVELARRTRASVVVSSYNEPLITSEWAASIFKEARAAGLMCAYVSNGNSTPEVMDYLRPSLSAYKVDLKCMQEKNYRKLGGVLQNTLDGIKRAREMGLWVEVVTLAIPGFNDSNEELWDVGDRMIYREKKMWDYDADLIARILGMKEEPELLKLGFEHSKLRYMYDDEGRKKKLHEMVSHVNKDVLFIEGGHMMRYGVSLGLDAMSVARDIGGQIVIVIDGHEDTLMDDAIFLKRYLDTSQFALKGLIFNKVRDVEDFKNLYFKKITDEGIPVLGVIPYQKELTYLTAHLLAERLFAKVITGEMALHRVIKNILVGAMSVNALFHTSLFQREDKLVITSGDRAE